MSITTATHTTTSESLQRTHKRTVSGVVVADLTEELGYTATNGPLVSPEYAIAAGILDARHGRPAAFTGPDRDCARAYYTAHKATRLAAVLIEAGYTTTDTLSARDWRALRELAGMPQSQAPSVYTQTMIAVIVANSRRGR